MKYRLMGIEKTLDNDKVKIRVVGMRNGVIVWHSFLCTNWWVKLEDLLSIIMVKNNLEIEDIVIPEHIKNTLKQKE